MLVRLVLRNGLRALLEGTGFIQTNQILAVHVQHII